MSKVSRPSQVSNIPENPPSTNKVLLDASVVLKIVKQSTDAYPATTSGQLLGLDEDGILSVSYGFAFPISANDNEGSGIRSKAVAKYQSEMVAHLKEVNVDANTVGWYISGNLGKIFNQNVIENMLYFQASNPESVLLVHDVTRSSQAGFSLEAFRLSPAYLATKKTGVFSTESLSKNELSYHSILERLPVEIHDSHLVALFINTLESQPPASISSTSLLSPDFDTLDISIGSYLEKNIEAIFDSVDDFHYDQGNYNYYQRQMSREKLKIQQWQQKRKAENTTRASAGKPLLSTEEYKTLFKLPEEPSRLDNLLISAQIDQFCSQIEEFGSLVTPKLFAFQKSLEGN